MSYKKRVLYQLVAPMEVTAGPAEVARRREFLQGYAAAGIEIEVQSVARGTAGIESRYDEAIVLPYILESIERAKADAVIVGCFSDPGLGAARERLGVPVIGPGEAAIHLALQLGDQFSILAPDTASASRTRTRVRQLGLSERYASCRGIGLSVPALAQRDPSAFDSIEQNARHCIGQDGADVLVLGCMSMAFLNPTMELSARLDIPVVNPIIAALKSAEAILAHGVLQSRRTWPRPPEKPIYERSLGAPKAIEAN